MIQLSPVERELERRFQAATLPHLPAIRRYARRLAPSEVDAQDAVQECYLSALRHFAGFRGGSVQAWLRAILRNVCHTHFARRARAELLAETPGEHGDVLEALWQEAPEWPDAIFRRQEDVAAVRLIVEALPPPLRQAIVLREFEGLSYQDIARVARTPIGTVMSRLARARAKLRVMWLSAHAEEPPSGPWACAAVAPGRQASPPDPRSRSQPSRAPAPRGGE